MRHLLQQEKPGKRPVVEQHRFKRERNRPHASFEITIIVSSVKEMATIIHDTRIVNTLICYLFEYFHEISDKITERVLNVEIRASRTYSKRKISKSLEL